jgi:hypothetical protein
MHLACQRRAMAEHSVQCAIYDPADAQLTSAVRNAGR